ncbi:MAG: murein hydrolase activator EnvC [Thermoleophilia bacterium]
MPRHWLLVSAGTIIVAAGLAGGSASAQGDIDSKRQQVAELNRELSALDAEAGAAAAAHNAALDRKDAVARRITRTRTEVRLTARELRSSRERLGRRMVALYVRGTPDPFQALLQSGDLADVLAVTDLLERTAAADTAVVERVRERRRALERLRARLTADAVIAGRELAEAQSHQRRLEALLGTRRRALEDAQAELGRLLAAERARLSRLAAQKREAREEARRATAAAVPAPSASTGASPPSGGAAPGPLPGGSHVYPLAGPSTFGDDWLASRPGGRYHEGIDLFAARGTPVVAVADGTLFRVGYSGISGNRFWLRDAAGTEFFYAHLDGYTAAAREGAAVAKGTVLGYNGDTGDARGTPPHVHFEIHPGGGGPVRPYPIVSAWPRVG